MVVLGVVVLGVVAFGVVVPRAAHPAVPWVRDLSSLACRAAGVAGSRFAARMDARSPSPQRWWTAAWPSAQSTRAGLVSFAIDTACAIFTRIRELPCAAASFNHSAAPST